MRRAAKNGGGGDVRVALGRALQEQNDAEGAKVEFKAAAEAEAEGGGEVLREALEALAGVYGELGEDDAAAACRQQLAGL